VPRVAHAQLSICPCRRRRPCPIFPSEPPARQLAVPRLAHVPPANESLPGPADHEHLLARCHREAITLRSVELCSTPCKARRFAPPTRVIRAWPSGLDAACAQLAGRRLRDGRVYTRETRVGHADHQHLRFSRAGISHDERDSRRIGSGTFEHGRAMAIGLPIPSPGRGQATGARPQACASCRPQARIPFPSSVTCHSDAGSGRPKTTNRKLPGGGW
jgi:hypothetical protein